MNFDYKMELIFPFYYQKAGTLTLVKKTLRNPSHRCNYRYIVETFHDTFYSSTLWISKSTMSLFTRNLYDTIIWTEIMQSPTSVTLSSSIRTRRSKRMKWSPPTYTQLTQQFGKTMQVSTTRTIMFPFNFNTIEILNDL